MNFRVSVVTMFSRTLFVGWDGMEGRKIGEDESNRVDSVESILHRIVYDIVYDTVVLTVYPTH